MRVPAFFLTSLNLSLQQIITSRSSSNTNIPFHIRLLEPLLALFVFGCYIRVGNMSFHFILNLVSHSVVNFD